MGDKNLYGVAFTIILTDGTALDGQVVILAEDEMTAKARTQILARSRQAVDGRSK